jgi:hypothetical protein
VRKKHLNKSANLADLTINDNQLEELAGGLSPEDRKTEEGLRASLRGAASRLRESRELIGSTLARYRTLYKYGKWQRFCKAVGIPPRTTHDYMVIARMNNKVSEELRRELEKQGVKLVPKNSEVVETACELSQQVSTKKAARTGLNDQEVAQIVKAAKATVEAGKIGQLTKYQTRERAAYCGLVALGDRPKDENDPREQTNLKAEFERVVKAAAYALGLDSVEGGPAAEGPGWLTNGDGQNAVNAR